MSTVFRSNFYFSGNFTNNSYYFYLCAKLEWNYNSLSFSDDLGQGIDVSRNFNNSSINFSFNNSSINFR